jgi:hypothetical protein
LIKHIAKFHTKDRVVAQLRLANVIAVIDPFGAPILLPTTTIAKAATALITEQKRRLTRPSLSIQVRRSQLVRRQQATQHAYVRFEDANILIDVKQR